MEMKLWSEISLHLNTLKYEFDQINSIMRSAAIQDGKKSTKVTFEDRKNSFRRIFAEILHKLSTLRSLKTGDEESGERMEELKKQFFSLRRRFKRNAETIQQKIYQIEEKRDDLAFEQEMDSI